MTRIETTRASARLNHTVSLAAALVAGVCLIAPGAKAQDDGAPPSARATGAAARADVYWTPERMKSAVPLDMPKATGPAKRVGEAAPKGKAQLHRGSPPTVDVGRNMERQLYVPDRNGASSRAETRDFATPGFFFTTSRVFPDAATRAYPNRAAGKLFFSDTVHGGNFVCSASVIAPRLIVTAGHCVAHGSPNAGVRHFHSNFLFVPAFRNGVAPFRQWNWVRATTTNNWFLSGSVPNLQDTAIIELADQNFGGVSRRIGEITGWLGTWTLGGRQLNNHITQIGYPCNLDSCARMQINNAPGIRIVSNNLELGSLMSGGSSGGPWIQDHGVAPTGASAFTAGNWVLATTSYEYLPAATNRVMGASIFQNAGFRGHGFGDLRALACSWRVGNC
jgi:V8-like Glu-specific endopeptidase